MVRAIPGNCLILYKVYDITGQLTRKDLGKLNHDYLLRNPYFQDVLLSGFNEPVKR